MTEVRASQSPATGLLLAVRLGDILYGIPIDAVDEVLPALPVEPLPDCPAFVRGVVFLRGKLVPVLDAAERLRLQDHQRPAEPHIVCLKTSLRLIGVEFDEALDLIDVESGDSLSFGEVGANGGFFSAVVEREGTVVRILNPAMLVSESEVSELTRIPRMSHRNS